MWYLTCKVFEGNWIKVAQISVCLYTLTGFNRWSNHRYKYGCMIIVISHEICSQPPCFGSHCTLKQY